MAWAAAAELAGLPGFPTSERRAREAAIRMGLPERRRPGRGGGTEYSVEALPPDARAAHAARAANDAKTASIPTATEAKATKSRQAALVVGWRKDRQDNVARVLVHFRRFWQGYGGQVTPALKAFVHQWNAAKIEGVDPALRAAYHRLGFSTVREWHLGVEEEGLAGITPPEHHRKGQFTALRGEVGSALIATLMAQPHLSAQAVFEALQTRFEPKLLPSDRAVRRAVTYWKGENKQVYTSATNPDAWRNKYMSAAGSYSQGYEAPNAKWELDSTVGDVMLSDGRRHHIVGVIDVGTRRRRFLVTPTSKANAIMALIRSTILAWGVPELLKTDNGADYTAQVLETALLGLGIEHQLCAPFSPQQKPHIERAIGALMHQLFETLPGYVGHSVADRKGIEARKGFAERMLKEKDYAVQFRLTPEQLQAELDAYCAKQDDRPRDTLAGRTPNQAAAGHQRKTINERALDVLLAPAAGSGLRVVGKKGLKIDRGFYNAAQLGGLEGSQVQIKVDAANLGRCWVFNLDGVFICEALDYERLGINAAEVAAERSATQKRVVKAQRAALRQVAAQIDTTSMVRAINRQRTADAVAAAPNVVALQRPPVEHTSAAIESIKAAGEALVDQAQIEAAQAALAASTAKQAQVLPLQQDEPRTRYARWLRLQERVDRNEALSSEERNWFEGYPKAPEWASMKAFFEGFGLTADQVLTG